MISRHRLAPSQPEEKVLWKPGDPPIFSLCHATNRPHAWEGAAKKWLERCDNPAIVEYILCFDEGSTLQYAAIRKVGFGSQHTIVNHGRKCAVNAWNASSQPATGKFLITVSDDWVPCKNWDTRIIEMIPDLDGEYVLEVNTGGDDSIMTFSLLTRAYLERLKREHGYSEGFFYPEYLGMCADNDYTECARMDKVVINGRHRLPMFQHFHPDYGTAQMDSTYEHQHRPQAWEVGHRVLDRRKQDRFKI